VGHLPIISGLLTLDTNAMPIRVLLADDHAVVRAGIKALLERESAIEVVGEASTGREALELARQLQPDVVVMDISMPDMDGLEATRQINEAGLASKVLVLTVHAQEQYLLPLLKAGAYGYVVKTSTPTDLLEAIRVVHRGNVFLYPSGANLLLNDYLTRGEAAAQSHARLLLTGREQEILTLAASGHTDREIGEQLYLSPSTVASHRAHIMEKLGLSRRHELVEYALKSGLLRKGQD
jgi:DNA-binding NarL/FixJ family response regulator